MNKIGLLNRFMLKDLSGLERELKFTFSNQNILHQALVHRSYLNEHPRFQLPNNERLEFLGDAVLELVVTDHLYHQYENPEGELTNWRASLVNATRCAEVAREMDLERYLYLSKGEAKDTNMKSRNYILANAVEALIGAIYLDQGYDVAAAFVHERIILKLPEILESHSYLDAKTNFQELTQAKVGLTPTYKVLEEIGPDHDKKFTIGVFVGGDMAGTGTGSSKQEAQMSAAQDALDNYLFKQ